VLGGIGATVGYSAVSGGAGSGAGGADVEGVQMTNTSQGITCPHCAHPLTACIGAQDGMVVRHWYCTACKYDNRATGRELRMTVEQVVAETKYRGPV
jgi:copper chaperone CopZ